MVEYFLAKTNKDFDAAAKLFSEYAVWLGIDLGFQHFEEELQNLKNMYNYKDGGIILCKQENKFIGCVAVRRISDVTAELKRMYVQPEYRQNGIGKKLLEKAIELAKRCRYEKIRLDTLNHMTPAINLYKKYGFYTITPYYNNPVETAVYFELML